MSSPSTGSGTGPGPGRGGHGMSGAHLATRPVPGLPRGYEFPAFEKTRLSNGVAVRTVHLPGRPLVSAAVVVRCGAAEEPADRAGVSSLTARALSEGTERYDAIALVEASERLGAELHAAAGWDATTAGVEVPASRLGPALELLAEMVLRPVFPASEVDRLRDQRLNEILQAYADPRRLANGGREHLVPPPSLSAPRYELLRPRPG